MKLNNQNRWEDNGHAYTCGEHIKLILSDGSRVEGKIEADRIGRYYVEEPSGNIYYITATDNVDSYDPDKNVIKFTAGEENAMHQYQEVYKEIGMDKIIDAKRDKNGVLSVQYQNEQWWHYNDKGQWW